MFLTFILPGAFLHIYTSDRFRCTNSPEKAVFKVNEKCLTLMENKKKRWKKSNRNQKRWQKCHGKIIVQFLFFFYNKITNENVNRRRMCTLK